jgi:hypothetical protein
MGVDPGREVDPRERRIRREGTGDVERPAVIGKRFDACR